MTTDFVRAPLVAALALAAASASAQTLSGWARLPAASSADGPTSGQFAGANPLSSDIRI